VNFDGPRFLVLGAGAVGGYFGGRLAAAEADVTFLVRPARVAALNERGLVIESPMGDLRLPVRVATADTLDGVFDTVLLTAKAYDLEQAIATIQSGPERQYCRCSTVCGISTGSMPHLVPSASWVGSPTSRRH
jgi:ketopantoate reductase